MVVTKPDVEEEEEEVDVLDEDDYDEPPIAPKCMLRRRTRQPLHPWQNI